MLLPVCMHSHCSAVSLRESTHSLTQLTHWGSQLSISAARWSCEAGESVAKWGPPNWKTRPPSSTKQGNLGCKCGPFYHQSGCTRVHQVCCGCGCGCKLDCVCLCVFVLACVSLLGFFVGFICTPQLYVGNGDTPNDLILSYLDAETGNVKTKMRKWHQTKKREREKKKTQQYPEKWMMATTSTTQQNQSKQKPTKQRKTDWRSLVIECNQR